ncbi:hypothetical protein JB92DRAFT_2838354 [Gautieria morchelliformis]|nr:hypothetical protein JB92DRAFT_2838354 [Gautieria morchelliformis]
MQQDEITVMKVTYHIRDALTRVETPDGTWLHMYRVPPWSLARAWAGIWIWGMGTGWVQIRHRRLSLSTQRQQGARTYEIELAAQSRGRPMPRRNAQGWHGGVTQAGSSTRPHPRACDPDHIPEAILRCSARSATLSSTSAAVSALLDVIVMSVVAPTPTPTAAIGFHRKVLTGSLPPQRTAGTATWCGGGEPGITQVVAAERAGGLVTVQEGSISRVRSG